MALSVRISGDGFERFTAAVQALGSEAKARGAYRKIINRQGALLRKDAVRILPKQTGLTGRTIRKAIGSPVRASNKNLSYRLTTRGGFISFKYFRARELRRGVTALPRSQRTFLGGAFMHGGLWPNRRFLFGRLGGHVFRPAGGGNAFNGWGRKVTKLKSDVRIPDELVKGDMKQSYDRIAKALPGAIEDEIKRLTMGAVS